jgi:HTH-type transcriptional regulator/antitoxin HigA
VDEDEGEMSRTLDFRKPHLLRDRFEYETAIHEVEALLEANPKRGSAEYERLEFLSVLVEQYEDEAFPIDQPTPQAVVDFMLEQKGMSRADLAEVMGGKSRVSEFFGGKRELSVNQVRALRETLGVPADLLIPETKSK